MGGKTKGSEWGGRVVSTKIEVPKVEQEILGTERIPKEEKEKRRGKQKVRAVGKKKN